MIRPASGEGAANADGHFQDPDGVSASGQAAARRAVCGSACSGHRVSTLGGTGPALDRIAQPLDGAAIILSA